MLLAGGDLGCCQVKLVFGSLHLRLIKLCSMGNGYFLLKCLFLKSCDIYLAIL